MSVRRTLAGLLVGAFAGALAAAPAAAQHATLRVEIGGESHTVAGRIIDGASAYPVAALGRLGASLAPDARGVSAMLLGDTVRFEVGAAFFRAAGAVHPLAFAVRRVDATVWVPEQFFIEWLPRRHASVRFSGGALRADAMAATGGAASRTSAAARGPEPTVPPAPARTASPARRVVVIDPGHGGVDPGKVGVNGLREKDLTLRISSRLHALLRDRGYEVHMTRTTDTLIALGDRSRMANRLKDGRPTSLFVSIHANSASSSAVSGFETFFLAEARTEDERRVAEMENAATRFETAPPDVAASDMDLIFSGLRNDFYQRASNDLAAVVQQHLAGFHPNRNRGVKQAGFHVLVGAFMPAILVEVGFLSNPAEARLLGTPAFQERLAVAIADAVDQYFHEHEHLLIADPG
jgi:N-acetylmuramoyl-L-alanine amidase